MSRVKKTIAAAILILFLASASLFFFFPLVVYVYPEGMSAYESRYSHPFFISDGYLLLSRSDGKESVIEKIKKPSLYIYTPFASSPDGKHYQDYTILKDDEEITLEEKAEEMMRSFLSDFPSKSIGFSYNGSDSTLSSLYETLHKDYPLLVDLGYKERVSVVNKDELIEKSNTLWGIIITSPEDEKELYRSTEARVIMKEVDAVAAVSLGSVVSIHYDWNRIIKNILDNGGSASYYTFSTLHK